jgi:Na+-driven multidrug efflux pump
MLLGKQLLGYLAVSGLFITVALSYTGGLQGRLVIAQSSLYISIISQIVIPLSLCMIIEASRPLTPADIWTAIVLGHVTRCILSVARFRQQKWRTLRWILSLRGRDALLFS